ncbi:hypothetical protein [Mesorhizobium sp. B2-8-3]|uniref:hypothetical protein n=1 Tax=Mesorhizobium sp. B2-8-3 TaxID=2589905 RepID=UPI00112D0D6E|nr:hypothetical protein [Mesorhizobium sp. B2-8-3]TPJ32848.1 hypothetical protein FJ418_17110 [Mesorhizobium sp. B2-8-3]
MQQSRQSIPAMRLIAIAFFLALCGVAQADPWWLESSQSAHPPGKQQAAAEDAAQNRENEGGETVWQRTITDPIALYTFVLTLFTGVLGASTVALWWETRRIRKSAAEDIRTLQRAYLSVEPYGVHAHNERGRARLPGDKGPFQSVPQIKISNAGNLPAREIRWVIEHKFNHDRRLDDFPIDETKCEGRNVIPPSGHMIQGGIVINVGEVGTTDPGELREETDRFLYVWGIVIYDDGFRETRRTRFCHRYNCVNLDYVLADVRAPKRGYIGRSIAAEFARYHRYGNDAD